MMVAIQNYLLYSTFNTLMLKNVSVQMSLFFFYLKESKKNPQVSVFLKVFVFVFYPNLSLFETWQVVKQGYFK